MMKWEAEQKGYSCNDCCFCRSNHPNPAEACDDEEGVCDWFEPLDECKGDE